MTVIISLQQVAANVSPGLQDIDCYLQLMANTECIQEARHVNMLNSQAESPQHYGPISCALACTKINFVKKITRHLFMISKYSFKVGGKSFDIYSGQP